MDMNLSIIILAVGNVSSKERKGAEGEMSRGKRGSDGARNDGGET